MVGTADPYYNRKPVPDELIKDVGYTGLSPEQEFYNRERKYSATGVDVRRFSNSRKGGMEPQDDPYYGRRSVSKAEIVDVGNTGLTPEQEFYNRERKYSATGVDVRRFSKSASGGLEPLNDPYYGRKRVSLAETAGIGETGSTPAEAYEVRERKQSLFQVSADPFDTLAGRHRQSVSGVASSASAAATRRRSSAVAPDADAAVHAHQASQHHHSGFDGDKLEPIMSRQELPPVDVGETSLTSSGISSSTTPQSQNGLARNGVGGEHTRFHDATTVGHNHNQQTYDDPDSVAPDERR
ncbi:hypothetical protein B0A52_04435 [Exophiala mesophila]|uniref:Uncharacterized protein n=1 Tax=Exophiala mesophila TaxID=212818 RepID=A0A438N9D4_EXOME|nr:hypothetical protein B0A52_04435 [Exophiala mesophila]